MKADQNQVDDIKEDMAQMIFGRSRRASLKALVCVSCGGEVPSPGKWRDEISEKEYHISALCCDCQDSVFGSGK